MYCYGYQDWHAKGRINVIGAIVGFAFLTVSLFEGNIIAKVFKKALKWLEKAAEQGHKQAQIELSEIYAEGLEDIGIKKDLKKADIWSKRAANNDNKEVQKYLDSSILCKDTSDSESNFKIGKNYYDFSDHLFALKCFNKSAQQNNADAQFYLGKMYRYGQGVEKDKTQALKWYTKAAETGNTKYQFHLAIMYIEGKGVKKSVKNGIYWLKKAAINDKNAEEYLKSGGSLFH